MPRYFHDNNRRYMPVWMGTPGHFHDNSRRSMPFSVIVTTLFAYTKIWESDFLFHHLIFRGTHLAYNIFTMVRCYDLTWISRWCLLISLAMGDKTASIAAVLIQYCKIFAYYVNIKFHKEYSSDFLWKVKQMHAMFLDILCLAIECVHTFSMVRPAPLLFKLKGFAWRRNKLCGATCPSHLERPTLIRAFTEISPSGIWPFITIGNLIGVPLVDSVKGVAIRLSP